MTAKIYFLYAGWHTHYHVRVESSICCFPRGLSGSLHSSKTWGRFTLIEKNLDYSEANMLRNIYFLDVLIISSSFAL